MTMPQIAAARASTHVPDAAAMIQMIRLKAIQMRHAPIHTRQA